MIASVYADGGCIRSNPSDIGGTYAWLHVDFNREIVHKDSGIILPKSIGMPNVTNNLAELYALLYGLSKLPSQWSGTIYSDSKITLGRLFHGHALNGIPERIAERIEPIKSRLNWARCTYVHLDGHPTAAQLALGRGKRGNPVSRFNVLCDRMCQDVARNYTSYG